MDLNKSFQILSMAARGRSAMQVARMGQQPRSCAKAQSAMEFLVTYGWAIVAIVIIAAALFYLGVLNPKGAQGNICLFPPGHSCYVFKIANGSGALFLDLGQATGRSIRVAGISCSQNESAALLALANNITVPSGDHRWVVAGDSGNYYNCTGAAGNNLTAATAPVGERYRGRMCISYVESGTEVIRTLCGDINARFDPSTGGAGGGGTPPTPVPTPTPIGISTCDYHIVSPGSYTLLNNVDSSATCVRIDSGGSNSTLDCGGRSITGNNVTGSYGIFLNGTSNVTVRNCTVKKFDNGIRVLSSSNSTLSNNNANSSVSWDMYCSGSSNITRTGNICSTSGKACSGCTNGVCNSTQCD